MAVSIAKTCIGCGACVQACPFGALEMGPEGIAVVAPDKCTECEKCIAVCPVAAISLPLGRKAVNKTESTDSHNNITEDTSMTAVSSTIEEIAVAGGDSNNKSDGVWVIVEHLGDKVSEVTYELMGIGKNLASKLRKPLSVVLLGNNVRKFVPLLYSYGADRVYLIDNPVFTHYRTETYSKASCYLVEKYNPEILLIGATTAGRDLAGAIATELRTGLTADCTILDIDTEKNILLASRPAFGGNIMATILCETHRPQMATVRPKVMKKLEPQNNREGLLIIEKFEILEDTIRTKVLDIVTNIKEQINIEDAEIIVCGGRGLQDKKSFDMLYDLADALGGTVAGSRAAVEAGWVEYSRQVGQTGKTVAPKLYFAIGISGAIQHTVGMEKSETIVAINTNPDCPMMKMATYGIVGDALKIIPKLIKEFINAKTASNVVSIIAQEV